MNTPNQWTKKELVAYILLFISNSDLQQSVEETNYIRSRVDKKTYTNVYKQFNKDNDYQCIQNIIKAVKTHNYYENDYAELFADIKLMIYADCESNEMEEATLSFIRKILKE